MCKLFNDNGILSKHIDASTPEEEREEVLSEFEKGEFKILCNCNLISEGITLPSAEACLMLRKTASLPLFIQQGCRALTPVKGKTAIIIDFVGNVFDFGFPTIERQWSIDSKVQEYDNEDDEGKFKIRMCQECFSTFLQAPVCPYCGAVYETTDVEIQNFRQIELKKIEEAKAAKMQRYRNSIQDKVSEYESPRECKNWFELVQYCQVRGYKPGYAFVLNKQLKLNYKPYGGKK